MQNISTHKIHCKKEGGEKLDREDEQGGRLTLVNSLTGSYPVDLAHSLVETRLMSPSSLDARALASASVGSPTKQASYFQHRMKFSPVGEKSFMEDRCVTHSELRDSTVNTVSFCASMFL